MHTILHPTDFTAESERAFQFALSIARDQSAELIVLHVICPETVTTQDCNGDELDRDSELFQNCWSRFERLRALANGVAVSLLVKVGRPVATILQVAYEENCGLIVLAAHHDSFLHYQFHGSVSESVGHLSQVPILCLRQSPFHQPEYRVIDGLERQLQNSELQAASLGRSPTASHSAEEGDPDERLDSPHLMCDRLQFAGPAGTELREYAR